MKRGTQLKSLFTLTIALLFSGSMFAQINLTIKNADGSAAASATIFTRNSTTGANTAIGTATVLGVYNFTPVAGTNYIIANAAGTQWNTYAPPAVPVSVTITLNSSFTLAMNDYVAGFTADKVTISKAMPYWVHPSVVHNPSWTAPAANYASQADIQSTLTSAFGWTATGLAPASVTNYTELTFATTGVKTITVSETASAAYGGCVGETKAFFTEAIDIPYLEFTNAADNAPNYTIGGGATGLVILSECESAATAINPTISNGDNTNEEYPWNLGMVYTVHNATIAGSNLTLGAAQTMPAALDINGDIAASTVSALNPIILDGTVGNAFVANSYSLLAAPTAFTTVNDDITVYVFDMATKGYNAKISRKSDYVAFRTAEIATPGSTDKTQWDDVNYSWYTNDNGGANRMLAYIVILPTPKTGPIYHINNQWAL